MKTLYRKNEAWKMVSFSANNENFESKFKETVLNKYHYLSDAVLDIVDFQVVSSDGDEFKFVVFFAIV